MKRGDNMKALDLDWMKEKAHIEWNADTEEFVPKKDAPQYVKDSYARYLEEIRTAAPGSV